MVVTSCTHTLFLRFKKFSHKILLLSGGVRRRAMKMKKKMLRGFVSVRTECLCIWRAQKKRTQWCTKEATADDDDVAKKCVYVCAYSILFTATMRCGEVVAQYIVASRCYRSSSIRLLVIVCSLLVNSAFILRFFFFLWYKQNG